MEKGLQIETTGDVNDRLQESQDGGVAVEVIVGGLQLEATDGERILQSEVTNIWREK